MAGNLTTNSSPVIKAQVYSDIILEQLQDGFLPDGLSRNVTDFGNGDTLYIPTIGETVIHDYQEDKPLKYDPIDTGQVTLNITEYVQGGSYISNKLKQDAYALAAIESQIPKQHLYKIQERYETDLLAQVNGQTLGDLNEINGQPHRWVAPKNGNSNRVLTFEDFVQMRLSFEKAYVPEGGWVAIVDPITEAAINQELASTAFDDKPQATGLIETGFAQNHRFLRNILGFDVFVSNRLPRIADETIDSESISGGIANVFMKIDDDMTKPIMHAWRQQPTVEGEYNRDFQRDEFSTVARWGFGLQRVDTLGCVISAADKYK